MLIYQSCEREKFPLQEIIGKHDFICLSSICEIPESNCPLSPFSSCYQLTAPFSLLDTFSSDSPKSCSHSVRKTKADEKENEHPQQFNTTAGSMSTSKKPKHSVRRNNQQKLEDVFEAIEDANWVLGEFLYRVFQLKDDDGGKRHGSKRHAKLASSFLQGMTQYTAAMIMIIDAWFRDPDGCISSSSAEGTLRKLHTPRFNPFSQINGIDPARNNRLSQSHGP